MQASAVTLCKDPKMYRLLILGDLEQQQEETIDKMGNVSILEVRG